MLHPGTGRPLQTITSPRPCLVQLKHDTNTCQPQITQEITIKPMGVDNYYKIVICIFLILSQFLNFNDLKYISNCEYAQLSGGQLSYLQFESFIVKIDLWVKKKFAVQQLAHKQILHSTYSQRTFAISNLNLMFCMPQLILSHTKIKLV